MNTNVINVQKYPISQILSSEDSKKAFYEIPKYQREYTWTKKNWEDLFDDLIEHDDGYFLGSIICINKTTDFINDSLRFEVVDGQQRITTISILLTAMCAYLTQHYTSLDDEQRSDLLQLKKKLVDKNEATNDGIRVVPQRQNSNLEDYMSLLSDNGLIAKRITPKKATTRKIYRAFAYFTQRINDTIEEKNNQPITTVFKI